MKILRLIHSANPEGGGVIEGVRITTEALLKRGHTVDVVSVDAPAQITGFNLSIPIIGVGPGKSGYGYCPHLDQWLAEHLADYDCAIVEGLWQYQGYALWKATRRLGKHAPPYFVYCHGMLDPWFKRTYPLKHLKKWLYWPWGEYRVLRDARQVIFTAEDERLLARESFWLYRCNEAIVNYGLEVPTYSQHDMDIAWANASPVTDAQPFLLYLGRLHCKKGGDLLIKSYRQLKEAGVGLPDLVMAGPEQDPTFTAHLKSLANNDPNIHFPGMIKGVAKWGALTNAQAMILPSHQENFGIVVAEALAMGTPTLITKPVNIWREVVESGAGLAEQDNEAGIKKLLADFTAQSEAAHIEMRKAAKLCYTKHFTLERSIDKLLAVITP